MNGRFVMAALMLVAAACVSNDGAESSTLPPPSTTLVAVEQTPSTRPGFVPSTSAAPADDPAVRWGFTAFPATLDDEGIGDAFTFVATEGNLIAHHFDDGIPYGITRGDGIPAELDTELSARRAFDDANPHLAVYVATAITNQTRDGIPTEWRGAAPPAGLSSFSDPEVRNGVLAWVALLAETFEPRWLNVAVEIDMYSVSRPDDFHNLASLYREMYATIKGRYPDMMVFASFQMELGDRTRVAELADALDLIGISTYPYIDGGGIPPDDFIDDLTTLGLPMAIAETGYPAADMPTIRGPREFTPMDQVEYVEWLGRRAQDPGLEFVVWFLPSDITEVIESTRGEVAERARLFEFLGLREADGATRPALDVWRTLASP
jgi:hypothetical protein